MPGTTAVRRGPYCFASCTSDAAHTIPRQPDSSAACTRFWRMCAGAPSSLVSTVTASGVGALGATYLNFHAQGGVAMLTAGVDGFVSGAARFTVVGMSWNLRSQNTW